MWRAVMLTGLLGLSGCFIHVRRGSGEAVTESRDVGPFTGVIADHAFDVDIAFGDHEQVDVFCDDNLMDTVITTVEHDDLLIRKVETDGPFVQIAPTVQCQIHVTMVAIERAAATGSGELSIEANDDALAGLHIVVSSGSGTVDVFGAITAPELEVTSSGSGGMRIANASSSLITIEATGSGSIDIEAGDSDQLGIDVSGSGSVDTRGVTAIDADVRVSGSGSVDLTATGSVKARVSGSGSIRVFGSPQQRDGDTSGSGEIVFL